MLTDTPIHGSNILKSFGYYPAHNTLVIEFIDGNIWSYLNVPAQAVEGLSNSDNPTKYFSKIIKKTYLREAILTANPKQTK